MVGVDYSGLGVAGHVPGVHDHLVVVEGWAVEPEGWNWYQGGRVGQWGSPPPLRGWRGYGRRPCVAVSPVVGKKRDWGLLGVTVGGAFTVPVVAETAEGDGTVPVT